MREKSQKIRLSPTGLLVLKKRYLRRDVEGRCVESPEEMLRRVACNVASANALYGNNTHATERAFYNTMAALEFLPNSPTLMNAGRELQQLAACFVLPVEDSIEHIFEMVKYSAIIHQSGGGTGFSFSKLRPKNDIVSTSGGPASGPVSFIRIFNEATEVINQGGFRRGANMAVLHITHPDILEFIDCKSRQGVLTNFNISVGVTDAFMKAVEKDKEYELINPRTGKVVKRLRAREVFDRLVDEAWKTGEPGVLFLDSINAANPTPKIGVIEATNPCGEQPLLPYESCVLGSVNLSRMLKGDKKPQVDWDRLREVIRHGVHFLDNIVDINKYPLPQVAEISKGNRKIGLGLMGFADMLIKMDIPYNSEEALETAGGLMKFFSQEANAASIELAKKRGVFPNFSGSVYDRPGGPRYRNVSRTTIAPTGTISIIAGCSSGIEPIFAFSFGRRILDEAFIPEVYDYFIEMAHREGFYSDRMMEEVSKEGSIQSIPYIPDVIKRVFVTAHDIPAEWHVRTQAAFQKYT
ncbi:MAG TPA: adenosylcobalamin-dependent ribonucleoside-diphosphate reductase, partial [Candidatus Avalokitesvara rifleensis]|uniref:adenosylcobalamin-dependent ribonucleoside-diphosphate reductase n=1 Tax=Candidatus Avalokitesvara rifleensis TaxID=3367620 RepID=UPI004025AA0B